MWTLLEQRPLRLIHRFLMFPLAISLENIALYHVHASPPRTVITV